jgi:hypothetical protein
MKKNNNVICKRRRMKRKTRMILSRRESNKNYVGKKDRGARSTSEKRGRNLDDNIILFLLCTLDTYASM